MSLFKNLFQQSQSSNSIKEMSLKKIESEGFPTKKNEVWKYTSLKNWIEKDYHLASAAGAEFQIQSQDTYPVVFVNGKFSASHSKIPSGVQVSETNSTESASDSFEALSKLSSEKTFQIHIQENLILDRPLELIFIAASQAAEAYTSSDLQIYLAQGAQVAILENHLQHGTGTFFIYHKTLVKSQAHSHIEYLQLQNVGNRSFHMNRSVFENFGPGSIKTCSLSLGALQSRHELDLQIHSADVSAQVLGVYALSENQQSDHYTNMNHHVGGSQTLQLYKGLLDQSSKSVFSGGVYIAKDAQKANSEQLNKNLLLSDKAEVNSQPRLQIYADDVKAAHGSTIGQLQKDELFYLQSRAIPKSLAIDMLSQAFVIDVIDRLDNQVLKSEALKALKKKTSVLQKVNS